MLASISAADLDTCCDMLSVAVVNALKLVKMIDKVSLFPELSTDSSASGHGNSTTVVKPIPSSEEETFYPSFVLSTENLRLHNRQTQKLIWVNIFSVTINAEAACFGDISNHSKQC